MQSLSDVDQILLLLIRDVRRAGVRERAEISGLLIEFSKFDFLSDGDHQMQDRELILFFSPSLLPN